MELRLGIFKWNKKVFNDKEIIYQLNLFDFQCFCILHLFDFILSFKKSIQNYKTWLNQIWINKLTKFWNFKQTPYFI